MNRITSIAIISLVLAAIFTGVVFFSVLPKTPAPVRTDTEDSKPVRMLTEQELSTLLDRCQADYLQRNREILTDFRKQLEIAGQEEFRTANRNIDGIVRRLTGVGTTSKLCWKMAKDRIMGTHDTEEALSEVLVPGFIRPCQAGCLEVGDAFQQFSLKMSENRNRYHADLLSAGSRLPQPQIDKWKDELALSHGYLSASFQELVLEKSITAIGAGLDVLFLKASLHALKNTCGFIAAKFAGSATTAGVCSCADGPLPIGDIAGGIIFIGSSIWCAYDIYKVQVILPQELHNTMKKSAETAERYAKEQAEMRAMELTASCEKESLSVLDGLKENVKNNGVAK